MVTLIPTNRDNSFFCRENDGGLNRAKDLSTERTKSEVAREKKM